MISRRSSAVLVRLAALLLLAATLAGCQKKTGDATVIEKEFIAAATEETKGKERVTDRDQWLALVEMTSDRRKVTLHLEQPEWDRLRIGDRVHVTYREGKYTGTIWASELNK